MFELLESALEFQIVGREAPGIETLLLGSGGTPAQFRSYVERLHLESATLVDPDRSLLHALGVSAEPLTLLVDSAARIVLADSRSTSQAAQYPMGEILSDIGGILKVGHQ